MQLPDDVRLVVSRHRDRFGHYTRYLRSNTHFIVISTTKAGHFDSVVQVLAHEMIHLYQAVAKTETNAQHNAEFRRISARVCRRFGWDPKTFIGTE
jgi:predicted SprT family Zn-dependent metalloprotease